MSKVYVANVFSVQRPGCLRITVTDECVTAIDEGARCRITITLLEGREAEIDTARRFLAERIDMHVSDKVLSDLIDALATERAR